MMMIGEYKQSHPTVQIPSSPDPTATNYSPSLSPYFSSLHRFLPSNTSSDDFSSDEFRMYDFKVRRCARGRSHDWTDCPFAHPGEKARRRDPRVYAYSGTACPDFRKGGCKRGDACEYAHGVFECWLHPTRYRTQACKDGARCPRRVCFFAHSIDQLRLLPEPDEIEASDVLAGLRGLRIGGSYSWGMGGPGRMFDTWNVSMEEEPAMERVESGKSLRSAMYAKIRRENTLDRAEPAPDFGWVSELVK